MSFRFNFGTADSDSDPDPDPDPANSPLPASTTAATTTESIQPCLHTLASLLPTLPQNISYTFGPAHTRLPRRELYDVRMQLMAEDSSLSLPSSSPPSLSSSSSTAAVAVGLGNEDIRTRVYEGGLKSWECSLDLCLHLLSSPFIPLISRSNSDSGTRTRTGKRGRVLELGCGTALPSLGIFQSMLQGEEDGKDGEMELVLADYNADVLRLVTLPNLLLVWAATTRGELLEDEGGDLHVSLQLRDEFERDLQRRRISLRFISGAWGHRFLQLLLPQGSGGEEEREGFDLVLASETIYSPSSTPEFTSVLLRSLKKPGGKALVAAKRIYFGVGGSVEDFVGLVDRLGLGQYSVTTVSDLADVGVGRVILEVT